MKYDIFISYRREGGYDTAKHLNDLLVRDGYKVSFDIDTLRSGDFDTQLLERIDQCKDFILIVDQHAFDRTLDTSFNPRNDWMRCELAYALEKKKNIIPIFLSGVTGFPANLPEDIAGVTTKNGPEYNRYYFNDFYKTLKTKFLHKKVRYKFVILFLLLLLVPAWYIYHRYCDNSNEDNVEEEINVEEDKSASINEIEFQEDITTYEIELLTVINTYVQAYEQGEYHNVYWTVFAQKPLTPLTRSYVKDPENTVFPNVLRFEGRMLYNGKPLSTYDTGETAEWSVSLYGPDEGPRLMCIVADYSSDLTNVQSIIRKAGFAQIKAKDFESYLYQKGELFLLLGVSWGSAGTFVDITISPDMAVIKRFCSYD